MRRLAVLQLLLPFLVSLVMAESSSNGRIETPADSLKLSKREEGQALFEGDTTSRTDGGAVVGTTFNGKNVPPPLEISGAKLNETIANGYWLVEFFSPYCGHCKHFAPTWQTLYEYYYTQEPVPKSQSSSAEDDSNSFTNYYNYHFGKVDCVANGDACVATKVDRFPSIMLFKDGTEVDRKIGGQDMKTMSEWVEQTLESIKPGSRPKEVLKLPKVGDNHADKVVAPVLVKSSKGVVALPNSEGKSHPLTAENFQRLVTMTHDPWFVKFYAPWCPHCQAMAPNWQAMSRQMKGQLNVGEVNCDIEKRLCKDVKVRGYPTILFFRGGERVEYDGLRGVGDLISFANKAVAVGDGVLDVNAADFEELEKKEEVIFLYFYDHATTSEDFEALDRLVMSLIGHAKLVKTRDRALCDRFKISTWPRLLVSRDGKPSYYPGLAPSDMRDFRRVLNWMQSVWLPIVPELTASNAREIMDGKLVVLGILSRDRPEGFATGKREIKNAALEWIDKQTQAFQLERQELRDAKQLKIEEAEDRNDQRALRSAKSIRINMDDIDRREIGFAWVDGVFWERWIKTTFGISVADGEKVIVNDEDHKQYWDTTRSGNPIVPSRTSIIDTLPAIIHSPPKISPKSTTTALGHVWWVIRGQLLEHPLVSAGIGLGLLVGTAIWGKKFVRKASDRAGGYFRVGEKGSPLDGLLGGANGMPQGKVD